MPRQQPVQIKARQLATVGLSSEKERKKVMAYLMFLARGGRVSRDFISPFQCCKEETVASALENEAKAKGAEVWNEGSALQ